MKKILAVTLIAALLLAGCSAAGGGVKLGQGVVTTIDKSADLAEKDGVSSGKTEAYTTIASVIVDDAGKVVKVKLDVAQTQITFDAEGKITSDKTAEQQTKVEKGDAYGMKKASSIGREWWEQAEAVEKWMVGKTAEQIAGMKVEEKDNHIVTTEADLASSATMGVDNLIAATVKAINNAK